MTMSGQTNNLMRIKLNNTTLISTEIGYAVTVIIFKAFHLKYYLIYRKSQMQTIELKMTNLSSRKSKRKRKKMTWIINNNLMQSSFAISNSKINKLSLNINDIKTNYSNYLIVPSLKTFHQTSKINNFNKNN